MRASLIKIKAPSNRKIPYASLTPTHKFFGEFCAPYAFADFYASSLRQRCRLPGDELPALWRLRPRVEIAQAQHLVHAVHFRFHLGAAGDERAVAAQAHALLEALLRLVARLRVDHRRRVCVNEVVVHQPLEQLDVRRHHRLEAHVLEREDFLFLRHAHLHISFATSTTSASLRHWSSSESALPWCVLAKPHCGDRHSLSSGT